MSHTAKVAVIGFGPSGIVATRTLLRDGFKNVKVFTKESCPGGTWARDKLYPDQWTNGPHFFFTLSGLDQTPEELADVDPLTRVFPGTAVASYLERFVAKYIPSEHICYNSVVTALRRPKGSATGWELQFRKDDQDHIEHFDKVVIATGNFNHPKFPSGIDPAGTTKFNGVYSHSSEMAKNAQRVLDAVPPSDPDEPRKQTVVVVGGGKSAADLAIWLVKEGRHVTMVMRESLRWIAVPSRPPPPWIVKSRFIFLFQPNIDLDSRIERFFHTTTIGAFLVRFVMSKAENYSNKKLGLKEGDPLRPRTPIFWGSRAAGPAKLKDPNSFHNLIKAGKIDIVCPASVEGFAPDGSGVVLDNGTVLKTSAVIFGTGFGKGWPKFMDTEVIEQVGLLPQPPPDNPQTWNYKTLKDPLYAPSQAPAPLFVRGIVPAKNFDARDLAFIGEPRTLGGFYLQEVVAHWVTSYLRADTFLSLTKETAISEAEREAAWLRQRYPTRECWATAGCNTADALANPIRYCDRLLLDMGLPIYRSGSGLFWLFKPATVEQIATLTEERAEKRVNKLSL